MKKHLKRVSDTCYRGLTYTESGKPIEIVLRKKKKDSKFPLTRRLQKIIFES